MFDQERLEQNRIKSVNAVHESHFYQFLHEDLMDRLDPIDKDFQEILLIDPPIKQILIDQLTEHKPHIISTAQIADQPHNKYDLIIFPFGFHWLSDVQAFLSSAHKILKPDGVFICNFPSGGSLNNLRRKLLELETLHTNTHAPHISPFIQFEHVTPLLQQAGFAENIIDMEQLELEYESPLALMHAIKNTGEANALASAPSYSINHDMYKELQNNNEPFTDHINLVTFLSSPTKNSIKLKGEK